ncbi:MAG: multidrug effflux MFS transporter [Sinobacteraceae bacterium]|nr:multidrug effflux MFS transporter [Nevskiaceae bacterium]
MTQERASSRPGWGFIILLGIASGLSAFGMASVVPALPTLSRALQADWASVQFIVSAYLLGLGLFQPVQGLLCDRFGRRPVLLGGFTLFLAASLLASFASSLLQLVLARFLQAIGVSVATVVSRAIVRDSFEPEPAAVALSFITAVMGVAPVIAPVFGGLATEAVGWRGIFWLHAAMALLVVALLAVMLRETRPPDTEAMTVSDLLAGARVLLGDRGFMGHALTYSFISASGFIFITVGAALYERLFALSGAEFGVLWSMLAVSYIGGAAAAGTLSRRLGRRPTRRVGLGINVAATLLFVVAAWLQPPLLGVFSVSLGMLMFANGLVSPLSLAAAVDDHPQLAGVAAGLSSSIAMLVSMVSAILTGLIYDGTAHGCALLMAITCALAWWAMRRADRATPHLPTTA